jgi:hypothetical protein
MAITYRADVGRPLTNAEVDANFAQLANGSIGGFLQSGGIARPWIDKLREIVSVKDFGAAGDGVTDDSQAFIDADDEDIGDIYVPDGTYIVDGVTLTGKKMFGPGTLKWKAASVVNMLTLASGASLDGLTFDGDASNQTGSVVGIVTDTSPYSRIVNCVFTNFRYMIIESDVAASPDCIVSNCVFYNTGVITSANGITIRSPRWTIQGNVFRDWNSDGHMVRIGLFGGDSTSVPVSGVSVVGNVFSDHPTSGGAGVLGESYATDAVVSGNTFDTMAAAIKFSDATVSRIAITGNNIKNITAASSLNLVTDSVTFSGNVLSSCGSVDIGDNAVVSNNVFDTCGTATTAVIQQSSGTTDAVISGNLIDGALDHAITVVGGGAQVTGNRITSATDRGVTVAGAGHSITGNYIDGCTIGINCDSTVTNTNINGNSVFNASSSTYAFVAAANFKTCQIDGQSNLGYAGTAFFYTIASGVITIGRTDKHVVVDTEASAASDDLDTISGGAYIGQTITLRSTTSTRDPTVKDGTGNLRLAGDCILTNADDTITLMFDGTNWREMCRSDNA